MQDRPHRLRLRVQIPGMPSREVTLDQLPVTVGRTAESELALGDNLVSRHHGEFLQSGSSVAFVDLGSRNGTRLNGVLMTPNVPAPLRGGDILQIGHIRIEVEQIGVPAPETPMPQLAIEPAGGEAFTLEVPSLPFTIGRAPDNGLVLHDGMVSSHHGRLEALGGRVAFVDLGSRNGTRLNGALLSPHEPTPLGNGDALMIGGSRVIVHLPSEQLATVPGIAPSQSWSVAVAPENEPIPVPVPGPMPSPPIPAPAPPPPQRGRSAGPCILLATFGVLSLCVVACIAVAAVALLLSDRGPRIAGIKAPADGMVQMAVPAGSFQMGSNVGEPDEQPLHEVDLKAFTIDKTKITVAMFSVYADSHSVEGAWSKDAPSRSPVVGVTFKDAAGYCSWQGRRLPTEAEWEKAARGESSQIYPWGNGWDPNRFDFGDFDIEPFPVASFDNVWGPVGRKPEAASPYGVLDMAGGPREWVDSWYAPYTGGPTPPIPFDEQTYRVTRGGFRTNNYSRDARTSARGYQLPSEGSPDLSFRCAK